MEISTGNKTYHSAIDIAKLFFALLVVGIHTSPFGFLFGLIKIYVIHPLFLRVFGNFHYLPYFFLVSLVSVIASLLVIYISDKKLFRWLKVLY